MNGDETKKDGRTGSIETHFSWIRTRMSAERRLESWVRTAVSFIGFGFTIVQFFERLNQMQGVLSLILP